MNRKRAINHDTYYCTLDLSMIIESITSSEAAKVKTTHFMTIRKRFFNGKVVLFSQCFLHTLTNARK